MERFSRIIMKKRKSVPFPYKQFVYNIFSLILVVASMFDAPSVLAQEPTDNRLTQVVNEYIPLAFSSNITLKKFESGMPISYRLICDEANELCGEFHMGTKLLGSGRLFERTPANGQIKIFVVSRNSASWEANRKSENGELVIENDSLGCSLRVRLDGSKILYAKILIEKEMPSRKIQICLAVQVFRALGLEMPDRGTFENVWPQLENVSEVTFSKVTGALEIMAFIHLCYSLRPGDSKTDVVSNLRNSNYCTTGIEGK